MTPMQQQYLEIKKQHPNAFLFFRLGDFYEMFGEDAKEGARLLGLTLTARHKGGENEIPMCGVPHHSADRYIAQLTRLGKRVAICEQVSDPSLPGIVQRQVVKVITPGTTLDETIVDTKKNNYLLSVLKGENLFGVSFLDLSTGEFKSTEVQEEKMLSDLFFLLDPAEVIVDQRSAFMSIGNVQHFAVTEYQLPYFEEPKEYLQKHFQVATLSGFGIDSFVIGLKAAAALLSYVKENQKTELPHIQKITSYRHSDVMLLDEATLRNLELLHTARDFRQEGSLLQVLDQTFTRMGARKIRQWLIAPLTSKEKINLRADAVAELFSDHDLRRALQAELKDCYDLERLVGRIGCGAANARDLNYLKVNLLKIPSFAIILKNAGSMLLQQLDQQFDPLLSLVGVLEKSIHPEPSPVLREGGMIADGYHPELDELRMILKHGKDWLIEYQERLRAETTISTLKVKFNQVFGYHIEISKAQAAKAPAAFQLKQNLLNANRYMTEELKAFEEKYLSAEERIHTLEYELFQKILETIIPSLASIQRNADLIAILDVLQSLAQLAIDEQYCRPILKEEIGLEIRGGRHPVIEKMLHKNHQTYIANDACLNPEQQIILLTGANMAGKSSYLRQVALIVLMAHIGSFVPAESAIIGITDRIFTRVGAADDLSRGQSTFMVEMIEAANIINNASPRSLIIFDELGRGTSTYDGVSIAWAVLEHLAHKVKALTLFATHYHELIEVANEIPQARNYSIAVSEKNGTIVFLRKVISGCVDRSYGIEVAKLAGLPNSVITRAKDILSELERDRFQEEQNLMGVQPDLFTASIVDQFPAQHRKIIDDLKNLDFNAMTPMQALQYLQQLQQDI